MYTKFQLPSYGTKSVSDPPYDTLNGCSVQCAKVSKTMVSGSFIK